MNNKKKQLLNVIEYSETMLKEAETGNWEKVIDIEVQRNELLEKIFSSASSRNEIDDVDTKIHHILNINKKIESAAANARDNMRNDISSISKGRQAVDFYAQNTG
jgi:hypothetical protein